ncbi:E3 ubiquitin-protein ligase WAV3-like isoform X1 [Salvia splendens]|uniref:E3 ubiquitin-protein ligase WAV3-like isoform X1 n=1 Tax=Salvia splendens TaxID=180675 RepID=UPI001C2673DC|nr:E3 ubiquitin-protein ligase WAV3-like isoform X1 [Salvia splendens]
MGWRRAFCNTLPLDKSSAAADKHRSSRSTRSNPSTPPLHCKTNCSKSVDGNNEIDSPNSKLESKSSVSTPRNRSSIRFRSAPSSPRSPFSVLKSTLRLSRSSCGVCVHSVKSGQGTAIYTAECGHAFHFPCIAAFVGKRRGLVCPVCAAVWKDVPLLAVYAQQNRQLEEEIDSGAKIAPLSSPNLKRRCNAPPYDDDEPLLTPNFNRIPDSVADEAEEEVEEFQGFFVNQISSESFTGGDLKTVEVSVSPEAAVISQGRTHDTYAVIVKVRAPPPPRIPGAATRAPIDLVAVLNVSASMTGAKIKMMKRAMRLVIASLGSADRLSVLAISAAPRLLPLRRMTLQGQRSARRIIDRLACSQGTSMAEALREATRVLEERRERNPVASIILLSDGLVSSADESSQHSRASSCSTRFSHVEIPVHSAGFSREPAENAFSKCVSGLLSVVVQDAHIQLGLAPGSDPAEITAVYSCNERPSILGSGCIRLGDLYAEEEKELLLEIRVPASRVGYGSHHVLSVKCCYKDPATQELIHGKDEALLVPRPQAVRSGLPRIERLRNVFITSRAVAESRRLIERNELASAMQMLSSARALLMQPTSEMAGEYVRGLEAEMAVVQWRRQQHQQKVAPRRWSSEEREIGLFVDENGKPLTPTSAWKAAEKLAKVAQVKKSFNKMKWGRRIPRRMWPPMIL